MTDVFCSTDELATRRDDVVVVDVRETWDYEDGHIPGAVNLPFGEFRDSSDEVEGKLPTADDFAALLGNAGISTDDRIVAYDDDFGVYASRFLVTAEVYGHPFDRLHVLDGDVTAWGADRELSTGVPEVEPSEYTAERTGTGPVVDAAALEDALDSEAVVVDTRDRIEYDTVHIAGAVNFQWRDLVDTDPRGLKPLASRHEILADHGIAMDRPVRLYCNTARRLSFVYAVLRELGHEDATFYEGGIDAWAAHGGPVETS